MHIPAALRADLDQWAELCRLGRATLFASKLAGFSAHVGTEAAKWQHATTLPTWPGGPWPKDGPANSLHQVGLMFANSAGGRFGEMGALLDQGEVAWSLPTHSRGILELLASLFRIYVRPFTPSPVPPHAANRMYAAAHLEMIDAAHSARTLCATHLALDPDDAERQQVLRNAENELDRLIKAYGPHYDRTTTTLTNSRNLRLGGVALGTMTAAVDDLAAWVWPARNSRPVSLYRLFSGHAHSSLDADLQLYGISDQPNRRELKRNVDRDFIALNLFIVALFFQRIFHRLATFYGWDQEPLHTYSTRLAQLFPDKFTYSRPTA